MFDTMKAYNFSFVRSNVSFRYIATSKQKSSIKYLSWRNVFGGSSRFGLVRVENIGSMIEWFWTVKH